MEAGRKAREPGGKCGLGADTRWAPAGMQFVEQGVNNPI
jgi:hypothetical protein